jgi:hypothetical protein
MGTTNDFLGFAKWLTAAMLGPSLFVGPLPARAAEAGGITVQVYNWASVAPQTLTAAETEATRIFRTAGVVVSWLTCPLVEAERQANPICAEPVPPSRIAIRINPDVPARLAKGSLGVALSEAGIYATIYYPRVTELASGGVASDAQILGHAIAHEMGHLLLGPAPHARYGLMHGGWSSQDLQSIRMGALLFSPREAAVIRQAALRRMARGSAFRVVLLRACRRSRETGMAPG